MSTFLGTACKLVRSKAGANANASLNILSLSVATTIQDDSELPGRAPEGAVVEVPSGQVGACPCAESASASS